MPKNSRVSKCVGDVVKSGKPKGVAIPICQASTHQSYATGKTETKAGKEVAPKGIRRRRKGG